MTRAVYVAPEAALRGVAGTVAGALAGAALLLAGCSDAGFKEAVQRRQQVIPVRAAVAVAKDVPVQLRAIGTVEPFASVSIKSRVEGQVSRVHFGEGQEVRQGDLLFTIDKRSFEAALRQAEANLARSRAEAANAEAGRKRLAQLHTQQIVSQEEYDQAQTRAASAGATVAAEEAAVDRARLQLQYCTITAPIGGRIGRILVNVGNVVKADDTVLAVVNQIRPIYVAFAVPHHELPEIRSRAAAGRLVVEAFPRAAHEGLVVGELSFVNNTVDTATGTVLLKALFPNADEALWPGQFVDTLLTLSVRSAAVVVPSAAVQTGQRGPYVFVIGADRTVSIRQVRTGPERGGEMVIEDDLRAGEEVVVDGQSQLAPGMSVEIKDGAGATPAPAAHLGSSAGTGA